MKFIHVCAPRTTGPLRSKDNFPESDFIAIFGNLMENAVHATADLPEEKRNIQVNVRMLSDAMMGLTVKNPYEGTIRLKKNGLPKQKQ